MFGINPMELMIILMVALIVVGPKRLPEIGRTVGRAFSELRRVQEEVRDTIRFDLEDDEPEPPTRPVRRPPSPDSPRTPSAAELASAAERERTGDPASEPDGAEVVPEVGVEVVPEVAAPPGGEPTVADPPTPAEAGAEGPIAPVERPADPDSPNGSSMRPARDEAG
jgi:Tat protein translocase TatB subunit